MIEILGLFVLAFAASTLLTPLVRRLAERFGVMDAPGGRKIHDRPKPLLGGLGIFLSFGLAVLVAEWRGVKFPLVGGETVPLQPLLLGSLLVVVLGIVDDVVSVKPAVKFLFQCVAGLILVGSGIAIQAVSDPMEPDYVQIHLGVWGMLLSLLWVVGITNALNLIDGLDGLASGVALIAAASFGVLAYLKGGHEGMVILCAILAGSIGGFLRYNFYPAKIFLGDTGSLFLGFTLASISILGNYKSATVVSLLVPILALGLPILDTLVAMARRLLRSLHLFEVDPQTKKLRVLFFGESAVWKADQDHIHHRLLQFGLSQRKAVAVLYGVSLLLAVAALSMNFFHGMNYGYFMAAVGILTFLSIRRLGYREFRVPTEDSLLWMYRQRFVGVRLVQGLSDALFIVGAFTASLVFATGGRFMAIRDTWINVTWIVLLVQIVTFVANGFYRGAWRYTNLRDMVTLSRGVFLACLLGYVITATFWSKAGVSVGVFINEFFILVFLVLSSRLSYRVLNLLRRSRRLEGQRVLLYGAGEGGAFALRELINNPELGMIPVGFLDDDPGKKGKNLGGVKILGGIAELDGIIERNSVSSIIVSSHKIEGERVEEIKRRCDAVGVHVQRLLFNLENA